MVRKDGDNQKTVERETTDEAKAISTISSEGELPCVLVFPDKRHIENYTFAPILDFIKQTLIEEGFKIRLLSDEARDLTRYVDEFAKIANECVYGVVVLDGLRPNVVLEFGILIGLKKPFTLLKSKDAEISVKTLYPDNLVSDSICKQCSGLTVKQFNDLRNPKLRLWSSDNHLSDLSTHFTIFDPSVNLDNTNHVSKMLKESIKLAKPLILEEYNKISSKSIAETMPQYLKKYQEILFTILQYYTKSIEFNFTDIGKIRKEIEELEKESGIRVLSGTRTIIASLYSSLVEKAEWRNVKEIIKYLSNALNVCNEALEYESDSSQKADIQRTVGNIYWETAQYQDKKENCKKAIEAYKEALRVYTLDRFPMDYAMTQNNLGTAYRTLAEVEAKAENCKKAIEAYEEALKVYTLERFPMDYAMTQNNLGNAYSTLAEVETKAENCKKAIEAYEEALKVYTLERFPMQCATTQNNLGNAYSTLAEVEAKAENCKKAIEAYEEALKVFTEEDFPEIYQLVKSNIRKLLDFCRGE